MRVFIAGASGVLGVRLTPLAVAAGHTVAGMTRSPGKTGLLRELGAEPVVCDVFDREALTREVTAFHPDVVMHQLTDLPDDAASIPQFSDRNNRIREEGTLNVILATVAAGAERVIAQSVSWELPGEAGRRAAAAHERMVLESGGVVVRYGQFYGPGTFYPDAPPPPPRIHIDDAARLTLPAFDVPAGVTMVVDDRAAAQGAAG